MRSAAHTRLRYGENRRMAPERHMPGHCTSSCGAAGSMAWQPENCSAGGGGGGATWMPAKGGRGGGWRNGVPTGLVDPVTILDFPQRGPCHSPRVLHMAEIGVAPGYARAAKVGRVRAHGQVDIRGNNAVDELASLGRGLPLFCVRTDVGAKGTGTQNLARKSFFHQ